MTDIERIQYDVEQLLEKLERLAKAHEPCERCALPYDNGPRLRPHTRTGWWQVWSGGLCVALLHPEDVAPLQAPAVSPTPSRRRGEKR